LSNLKGVELVSACFKFGGNMSFHKILWDYSRKESTTENNELALQELKALVDAGKNPLDVPENYPDVFGLATLKGLDAIRFAFALGRGSLGTSLKYYYNDKKMRDNPLKVEGKRSRRYE
jgi:hypothetical protein